MNMFVILLGIIFNVLASFLIKYSHIRSSIYLEILEFKLNIFVLLSAVLYFCAFIMYYLSLSGLALSKAQPIFTIGTMLGVASIGVFFFRESFDWNIIIAYSLFIIGIVLLSVKWEVDDILPWAQSHNLSIDQVKSGEIF